MLFCLKVALLLLIKSISANSCIVLLTEAFIVGHLQELSVVKRITFMWSTCTIAFGSVCACPPVSHSVTRTVGALRSGSLSVSLLCIKGFCSLSTSFGVGEASAVSHSCGHRWILSISSWFHPSFLHLHVSETEVVFLFLQNQEETYE